MWSLMKGLGGWGGRGKVTETALVLLGAEAYGVDVGKDMGHVVVGPWDIDSRHLYSSVFILV